MRFLVVAVGERMPSWIEEGFADYQRRLPRHLRLELKQIRPEPRRESRSTEQLLAAEAARIGAALPRDALHIVLDEHGRALTTAELARMTADWAASGRDVAFLIGGPDGLAASLKAKAALTMRLSSFTLPHGLARVVLAEQLYRAVSILSYHPYHRE
jgi:23S rRNA (pseudouridine1915-N3)-methyltransferase